jgi:hypothetical protein
MSVSPSAPACPPASVFDRLLAVLPPPEPPPDASASGRCRSAADVDVLLDLHDPAETRT